MRNTLIKKLEEGTVQLPDGRHGELIDVPMKDLAISHAWLVKDQKLREELIDPDAVRKTRTRWAEGGGFGGNLVAGKVAMCRQPERTIKLIKVNRFDFIVQFVWQPKTRAERAELKAQREATEQAAAEAAAAEAAAADGEVVNVNLHSNSLE